MVALTMIGCVLSWHSPLMALRSSSLGPRMRQGTMASSDLDPDLLARRIKQVRDAQEPTPVRLLVLDAMVPGQRLSFTVRKNPSLVETLRQHDNNLVMFGVDPSRRVLCTHGVSVSVASLSERADGDADISLAAERLCELHELGQDEGSSRWAGRAATVRWVNLEAPDESMTDAVLARSAALERIVDSWAALVRNGRERSAGQLNGVIDDLGPMPDAGAVSERALWVAGLINPLPALGVALEVRPATLMAPNAERRLEVVEAGIKDSIARLESPGPAF